MTNERSDRTPLDERFAALVEVSGGADRPDWVSNATADAAFRDRLGEMAATLTATSDGSPAEAYQARLGDRERTATGHFRTHPGIATALCQWAIQSRSDGQLPRVLDPATGAGVFSAAAYDRLAALSPDTAPEAYLKQIVGIDIDPISLALTANRLLTRAGSPTNTSLQLYETDFFDVRPEPGDSESITVTDEGVVAGQFDAIVGNPPYIRQESVDTDHVRAHLSALGPDGKAPYLDGASALSRRSDVYVYFVTHATRFLRDGGRLGMILPSKWLTTRYGEPFQQFLFDHYRLTAVVGSAIRAFDDALVDAVFLLAERCMDPTRRRTTPVQFCRLEEQQTVSQFLSTIESPTTTTTTTTDTDTHTDANTHSDTSSDAHTDTDTDTNINTDIQASSRTVHVDRTSTSRTVTIRQGDLADGESEKLAPYLDAPAPFIHLLEDDGLVRLGDLGRISRGVMTGANEFFFLTDDGDGRAAEIDDRFLTPAIKSIRDVDDRVVTLADTDRYLLDAHDYVVSVVDGDAGVDIDTDVDATIVLDALARDGYDGLRSYVEWGERQGFHDRRSCASRQVWFDLGTLSAPAVFVPKFFDERVTAVANPDGLLASNAVDCLWLADDVASDDVDININVNATITGDVNTDVLLGLLNATVTKILLECWGRTEGGGALQLLTYELATLPVPDPRAFAPETCRAIATATDDLLAGDTSAQRRLDQIVLDAIDLDLSVEECDTLRKKMISRRVQTDKQDSTPVVTD